MSGLEAEIKVGFRSKPLQESRVLHMRFASKTSFLEAKAKREEPIMNEDWAGGRGVGLDLG